MATETTTPSLAGTCADPETATSYCCSGAADCSRERNFNNPKECPFLRPCTDETNFNEAGYVCTQDDRTECRSSHANLMYGCLPSDNETTCPTCASRDLTRMSINGRDFCVHSSANKFHPRYANICPFTVKTAWNVLDARSGVGLSDADALGKCRTFCANRGQRAVCIPPADKPSTDQMYMAFKYGCVLEDDKTKRDDVSGLSEATCEDAGSSSRPGDTKADEEAEEDTPPPMDPMSCAAQTTAEKCASRTGTNLDCMWSNNKCIEDPRNCNQYDNDVTACKSQYPCAWDTAWKNKDDHTKIGTCFNPTLHACSSELGPDACRGRSDCFWVRTTCWSMSNFVTMLVWVSLCALVLLGALVSMVRRYGRERAGFLSSGGPARSLRFTN
jgi:hypothetical protein